MKHYAKIAIIAIASIFLLPISVFGQIYVYPADNDADYYDQQYHTPVTPITPKYHQPTRYPTDNDEDYYEYYYGTSTVDEQYQDDNFYYQQQPPQYQDYRQAYPQDNDEDYYANPAYAPSVNQWDD